MRTKSVEYTLGYYIGEYILHRFLPTLSTHPLQTRKVIEVSKEDTDENKRLESIWFSIANSKRDSSESWQAYHEHNKILDQKYLPHNLICHIPPINLENVNEIKNGLIDSLWNSDLCCYSLKPENIKMSNDKYFTIIEFVLNDD